MIDWCLIFHGSDRMSLVIELCLIFHGSDRVLLVTELCFIFHGSVVSLVTELYLVSRGYDRASWLITHFSWLWPSKNESCLIVHGYDKTLFMVESYLILFGCYGTFWLNYALCFVVMIEFGSLVISDA